MIHDSESNSTVKRRAALDTPLGISAIETLEPSGILHNDWFESLMAKKFVKHTGILSRRISALDEQQMAIRVVEQLIDELGCDPRDCAGIVVACPSMIPQAVANRYLDRQQARSEQLNRLALEVVQGLPVTPRSAIGINGFCSGYAKAMQIVRERVAPRVQLTSREYILVVTTSRISRITDFSCRQSGALFGDYATATVVARVDSARYPTHFEMVDAEYSRQPAKGAYFNFVLKQAALRPAKDGKKQLEDRVVFTLDGMGIADTAPRAMAAAAKEMAGKHDLDPAHVDHIAPHQAGLGIVRLTGMKLEEAGFSKPPINGLTVNIGNISSASVPYTLKKHWQNLYGHILCPVAAVGSPGKKEVSQGCLLLRRPRQAQRHAA